MVKKTKKDTKADSRDINALFNLYFKNRNNIRDAVTIMLFGFVIILISIITLHFLTYADPSLDATLSRWGYEEVCDDWEIIDKYILLSDKADDCYYFCDCCSGSVACFNDYKATGDSYCYSYRSWAYIESGAYDEKVRCLEECSAVEPYIFRYTEEVCTEWILVKK